eukprot:TRINITY_DN9246_c0_g1_i1.p1 TRINITY_DN9246_c0_g1~~TRINITY_DN9246_c0_g1_i1.p1  ORF type:complete len:662 (-),score=132.17 TRINITY_DN9246_c0_g1_i1:27-2012(-)
MIRYFLADTLKGSVSKKSINPIRSVRPVRSYKHLNTKRCRPSVLKKHVNIRRDYRFNAFLFEDIKEQQKEEKDQQDQGGEKQEGKSEEKPKKVRKRRFLKFMGVLLVAGLVATAYVQLVKYLRIGKPRSPIGDFLGSGLSHKLLSGAMIFVSIYRALTTYWFFAGLWIDYKYHYTVLGIEELEEKGDMEKVEELMTPTYSRGADKILELCLKHQGLYVKFGQALASMQGFLPKVYAEKLKVLLDNVTSIPFEEVEQIILQEFGLTVDEMFLEISREPIASASLAQVHRGVLLDGREVAVKIQYPEVGFFHSTDISTHKVLMEVMTRISDQFRKVPDSFYEKLSRELDFDYEASNISLCREKLKNNNDAYAPKVYDEFTTRYVLTMEFIHGVNITNFDTICGKWNFSKGTIANILFNVFSEMIFMHGLVHGDPHPANIFVRPNPSNTKRPQIVILDHGLYDHLSDDFRVRYAQFWKALILNDEKEIKNYCNYYGIKNHKLYASILMMQRFDVDVQLEDRDHEKSKQNQDLTKMRRHDPSDLKNKKLQEDFKNIIDNFPDEMRLIMRSYFLLRSINIQLGAPVNRFVIMARVAAAAVAKERGTFGSFRSRINFEINIMWFKFTSALVAFALKYFSWVIKYFIKKQVDDMLEETQNDGDVELVD